MLRRGRRRRRAGARRRRPGAGDTMPGMARSAPARSRRASAHPRAMSPRRSGIRPSPAPQHPPQHPRARAHPGIRPRPRDQAAMLQRWRAPGSAPVRRVSPSPARRRLGDRGRRSRDRRPRLVHPATLDRPGSHATSRRTPTLVTRDAQEHSVGKVGSASVSFPPADVVHFGPRRGRPAAPSPCATRAAPAAGRPRRGPKCTTSAGGNDTEAEPTRPQSSTALSLPSTAGITCRSHASRRTAPAGIGWSMPSIVTAPISVRSWSSVICTMTATTTPTMRRATSARSSRCGPTRSWRSAGTRSGAK
jgi:hypothetical protein